MRFTPVFALLLVAASAHAALDVPPAPPTRVEVVRDTLHGVVIEDPYRWLESRDAPETRAWVSVQHERTKGVLDRVPGRERITARLEPLLRTDTRGVPVTRGGRYFFSMRGATQQLPVIAMRRSQDGPDRVLVDPNTWNEGGKKSASLMQVSEDGRQILWGVRFGGEDELQPRRLDVETLAELPCGLPRARYLGTAFAKDGSGCFYATYANNSGGVYWHRFGDDATNDRKLFGDGLTPSEGVAVDLSEDGRWLLISVWVGSAGDRTRLYLKDVLADGPIVPVVTDVPASFRAQMAGGRMWILTNHEAPNRRLYSADPTNPARERWTLVVPERADAVLEDAQLAGGKLWLSYLKNVASELSWMPVGAAGAAAGAAVAVSLPGLGRVTGVRGEPAGPEVFFEFESYGRPKTLYRAETASGRTTTWWRSSLPIESDRYVVEQVWAPSKDGTKIPMFLFHKRGLKRDGSNPTLLNGYGGFNQSQAPRFSALAAAWVEMGGVWAAAGLRGGGEFGEPWHRAGMLEQKQNTFDDFIGCAEWLIANRLTSREKLAIRGGSNGGLLVGAAMTQRPELFGAVICSVPLIDMLRYQNFLVARFWTPEYGSSEDPEQFRWLHAYSPYHRVVKGAKYPATLIVSGDSDTRVDPCHARKFAALLQANSAGGPVLLHYDVTSGHTGGGTPVAKQLADDSDLLAFLSWRLGAVPPPAKPRALPAGTRH